MASLEFFAKRIHVHGLKSHVTQAHRRMQPSAAGAGRWSDVRFQMWVRCVLSTQRLSKWQEWRYFPDKDTGHELELEL